MTKTSLALGFAPLTDCAVIGIVIAGDRGKPVAVTTLPWLSSEKEPSRE